MVLASEAAQDTPHLDAWKSPAKRSSPQVRQPMGRSPSSFQTLARELHSQSPVRGARRVWRQLRLPQRLVCEPRWLRLGLIIAVIATLSGMSYLRQPGRVGAVLTPASSKLPVDLSGSSAAAAAAAAAAAGGSLSTDGSQPRAAADDALVFATGGTVAAGSSSAAAASATAGGSSRSVSATEPDGAAAAEQLPASAGGPSADDVPMCMQDGAEHSAAQQPFSMDDFLTGQPTRLKLELELRSKLPRSQRAVTMMATSDVGRLHLLEGLCQSWYSIMTVAVYVSLMPGPEAAVKVAEARAALLEQFERLENLGACQADLTLYSEVVADQRAAALFPVNSLRNQAILSARTPLVLMANIDMLIGSSFNAFMASPEGYQEMVELASAEHIIVIAAFESKKLSTVIRAVEGGKPVAVDLFRKRELRYFHQNFYRGGQANVRYLQWLDATAPYPTNRTRTDFEPWYVMQRSRVSCYDERYRGRGKNKVQHVQMLMRQYNYSCIVHDKAYMVHRPHPRSSSQKLFDHPPEELGSLKMVVEQWFKLQLKDHERNLSVHVSPAWRRCQRQLPWWQMLWNGEAPSETARHICHTRHDDLMERAAD